MGKNYAVVCVQSIAQLEHAIEDYLKRGWKLAGGIAVDAGGFKYQVVYREKPITKETKDAESSGGGESQVEKVPGTE